MREKARDRVVGAELEVALWAKGRVGSDGNAELLAERHEPLLGKVRVELHLVHSRLDAGIAEEVNEKRALEVAVIGVSAA